MIIYMLAVFHSNGKSAGTDEVEFFENYEDAVKAKGEKTHTDSYKWIIMECEEVG